MAGTQAPKGFGILSALVGVPLILWDASRTNDQLKALEALSSAPDGRIELCVERTAEIVPNDDLRADVCKCVVDKATKRGALGQYGSYDADQLNPIVSECVRGDWD